MWFDIFLHNKVALGKRISQSSFQLGTNRMSGRSTLTVSLKPSWRIVLGLGGAPANIEPTLVGQSRGVKLEVIFYERFAKQKVRGNEG